MLRHALAFATFAALSIAVACSGNDTSAVDGGPVVDASKEAAPAITCGGKVYPNNITCRKGAAGMACDIVSVKLICPDAGGPDWVCSPGSVPADQCGCNTQGTNLQPGDPCGVAQDAAAE